MIHDSLPHPFQEFEEEFRDVYAEAITQLESCWADSSLVRLVKRRASQLEIRRCVRKLVPASIVLPSDLFDSELSKLSRRIVDNAA